MTTPPGMETDTPEIEVYRGRLKSILSFDPPEYKEAKMMLLLDDVWTDAKSQGDMEDPEHDDDPGIGDNKFDRMIADRIVMLLNDALRLDPEGMQSMCWFRIVCNPALANHPTIQSTSIGVQYQIGMLGLLNGIVGTNPDGVGMILAKVHDSDSRKLVEFFVHEGRAADGIVPPEPVKPDCSKDVAKAFRQILALSDEGCNNCEYPVDGKLEFCGSCSKRIAMAVWRSAGSLESKP